MEYDSGSVYEIVTVDILPDVIKEYPNCNEELMTERIWFAVENIANYLNSTILPPRQLQNYYDVYPFGENKELLWKDYIPEKGMLIIEIINPFS